MTKVWTTQNGVTIYIKDMTDSHLLNAICFLEKKHTEAYLKLGINPFHEDSMASYCFDQTLQQEMITVIEERFPIYLQLIREKERRKL